MKENLVLIVNQYAGMNQHNRKTPIPGKWKGIEKTVIETLKKNYELDINITEFGREYFEETTISKTNQFIDEKNTTFVFVGGDDTFDYGLTNTIKTLKKNNTDTTRFNFGYIPSGEGVALKYALALGEIRQNLELITNKEENTSIIDVINFNDERYGFFGGHGYFGEVVFEREKTKSSGIIGFVWPAIKTYFSKMKNRYKKYIALKGNFDYETLEDVGILVSKIRNIGGGINLIPNAKLNDGKLHVISYDFFPNNTTSYETEEILIRQNDHLHYGGDYQGNKSLKLCIEKNAINMILNKRYLEKEGILL